MKILIVKTFPGEINIKKSIYNYQEIGLARALIESGHQCDVMCTAERESSIQKIPVSNGNITLYCMKAITVLKNGFYLKVDDIFSKYDILQASEYNQLFTWYMAKKYQKKMVCYHGPYYSAFNKRYNLMAQIFDFFFLTRYKRLNTQFITKSKLAEHYLKMKGLNNICALGVGIDRQSLICCADDKLDLVDEIKNHSGIKIMYIGRLEKRRNVIFLLEILEELRKKIDVCLVLVGTGNKKYVNHFFKKAEKMKLSKYIIYRESVEQKYMEQLYGCTEIFVMPSFYDIYGMVLIEAMYFKQCVFTTLNGGADMMIRDGENGYIIEDFNVEEWVKKISAIIKDREKRNDIARRAYKTVDERFTWQKLVPAFIREYEGKIMR